MSAQGGTLARRGAVHLPIWPVAALLGAAVGAAITMSVLAGGTKSIVTSVTDSERLANSNAAVREQGTVQGSDLGTTTALSGYQAWLTHPIDAGIVEGSAAAVREMGATLPFEGVNPGMWTLTQAEAYVDGLVTHAIGLENPGAYPETSPKVGGRQPIEVNGSICGQCR